MSMLPKFSAVVDNTYPYRRQALGLAISAILGAASSPLPAAVANPQPMTSDIEVATQTASHTATVSSAALQRARQLADTKKLAESRTWLRLLYYPEPDKQGKQLLESRIVNAFNKPETQKQFFVSERGATDPQAELEAMLNAMFDPTLTGNAAMQCRFPARSHWLKTTLGIRDADLPAADCQALNTWLNNINPQGASIIFAAEYLDNPASAFAHSFLRFDHDNRAPRYYLNYTPQVIDGESFVKFTYKSTIAGNAGVISVSNYEKDIIDYKDNQGRDVWQYRLHLTDAQVQQLARQVYEIKDQTLRYRLLDENCASEILVLLNALFPADNLMADMPFHVAPAQVIRRLSQAGLVDEGRFDPSRITKAQAISNMGLTSPSELAQTALVPNRNNPLLAPLLSRFDIGLVSGQSADDTQSALRLGYRVVYHDALDAQSGYPIGSQLTALAAAVNVYPAHHTDKRVELDHATLINMRTLNPVNTAKAKRSWGTDISLQQVYDGIKADDNTHLVGNLKYETGVSYAYGQPLKHTGELPPNLCYALGNVATQVGKGLYHGYRAGVGANVGCIHQFMPTLRGLAEVTLPYWLSGDSDNERYFQPAITLGAQYDLTRHQALRVTATHQTTQATQDAEKSNQDEIALSYLHYFE